MEPHQADLIWLRRSATMLQPSASIGVEPDLLIGVLDELFSQRALLQFDPDDDGRPFQLWRLMIAADHQGYGRAAVLLGVEGCQRRNATPTVTTWPPTQARHLLIVVPLARRLEPITRLCFANPLLTTRSLTGPARKGVTIRLDLKVRELDPSFGHRRGGRRRLHPCVRLAPIAHAEPE